MINIFHPSYIHPRADLLNYKMLSVARKHNVGVNVWTVNNEPAIKWCLNNGVDGIITDLEVKNG